MAEVSIAIGGAYASEIVPTEPEQFTLQSVEWFSSQVSQVPEDAIGLAFPKTGCIHMVPPEVFENMAKCSANCRELLSRAKVPGFLRLVSFEEDGPHFLRLILLPPRTNN